MEETPRLERVISQMLSSLGAFGEAARGAGRTSDANGNVLRCSIL